MWQVCLCVVHLKFCLIGCRCVFFLCFITRFRGSFKLHSRPLGSRPFACSLSRSLCLTLSKRWRLRGSVVDVVANVCCNFFLPFCAFRFLIWLLSVTSRGLTPMLLNVSESPPGIQQMHTYIQMYIHMCIYSRILRVGVWRRPVTLSISPWFIDKNAYKCHCVPLSFTAYLTSMS